VSLCRHYRRPMIDLGTIGSPREHAHELHANCCRCDRCRSTIRATASPVTQVLRANCSIVARLSVPIAPHPVARNLLSRLIPSSGRGACLVEHLCQLLALLRGGPLAGDAVLVCPVIRICVPRREHLVVVAGDLGHRNRRCPAHAPATLADLIWSFHLIARPLACVDRYSMCRHPCRTQSGVRGYRAGQDRGQRALRSTTLRSR
jgi:hypothetical protein